MTLTKRQEAELEVAVLKMLTFSLRVTRWDRIRNEYMRGTPRAEFGDKDRGNTETVWTSAKEG